MRTQLSAPVSLIVILIGAGLIYYVFHSHGWSFGSDVSLGYTYRSLPVPFSFLVIAGFVMSAWGTRRWTIRKWRRCRSTTMMR